MLGGIHGLLFRVCGVSNQQQQCTFYLSRLLALLDQQASLIHVLQLCYFSETHL